MLGISISNKCHGNIQCSYNSSNLERHHGCIQRRPYDIISSGIRSIIVVSSDARMVPFPYKYKASWLYPATSIWYNFLGDVELHGCIQRRPYDTISSGIRSIMVVSSDVRMKPFPREYSGHHNTYLSQHRRVAYQDIYTRNISGRISYKVAYTRSTSSVKG